MQLLPILSYVQHYKKYHAARFEAASVQYGLNQLEIDILLFLHNNPDCRTASDICRYRGLAKSNVSAAVERLRARGVLTVSPAPDNRRQRLLGFAPDALPATLRLPMAEGDALLLNAERWSLLRQRVLQTLEQFHVSDERKAVEVERDLRKLGREPVWKDWDQSFDFKR